jgi:excisionase family DNA binding protein
MAKPTFRSWVRSQVRWLQSHEAAADESPNLFEDAAAILHEARRRAVAAGLPDMAAILATVKTEAVSLTTAQQVLAEVLAVLPARKQTADKPLGAWLTKEQVARLLNISVRSVYRLSSDGTLPKPRKMGRSTRWRREAIEQWRASSDVRAARIGKSSTRTNSAAGGR